LELLFREKILKTINEKEGVLILSSRRRKYNNYTIDWREVATTITLLEGGCNK